MSPKGLRHERLKFALSRFWTKRLPDEIGLITETTFRLDKDTFVEPDFLFFRVADGLANLSPRRRCSRSKSRIRASITISSARPSSMPSMACRRSG